MKVSVIGTTGYGGGELVRILNNHPYFKVHSIHSSRGEQPITEEFPHLASIFEYSLQPIDAEKIASEADIVFMATPSGVSSRLAGEFLNKDVQVVDLSGDLRLINSEDYVNWYKLEPASQELLETAVYGLSEWNKDKIQNARIVANPGCYPTAALLGLGPLASKGVIEPGSIIIDAKSGISGAGKSLSRTNAFAEMNDNFRIYKVNEHQHIPEIEQQLINWDPQTAPISFSTHLLPVTRGIMATIYVQLTAEMSIGQLIDLYKETYADHPFVRVRDGKHYPSIKEVNGSNFCDIGLALDQRTGRVTIVSVIDNLMKGAAGQAVQNANLMNGFDEKAGLGFIPVYP